MTQNDTVTVTRAPLRLPTYPVGEPERNPLFFEKRVYQGSCGKVYPVPFVDKVGDRARKRAYDAVTLENAWVRVTVLPELGGRIYLGQDKANHDYDFFYRNDVIKPALVGLAGPWVSGGVEFNWPQHHRPGTFMPTDVFIERGEDGSATVWMSEHDPLNRLRGTHGVCLRPGSAAIELKVRLVNRTERTQTFLWWANVAARVHDRYESFFPEDVHYVADHAVRAMTDFPLAHGRYYGVDYGARRGRNDLRRYRDIPVPTSYMVCRTDFDFFGGYDHDVGGGFVHVADRFIAPGKKQWTWGNHAFGHAWDRELTDANGPYVELMAGVYTDNQPDFTYLRPYETRTFSQFWWPYQALGPVQNANRRAALRFVRAKGKLEVGAAVPEALHGRRAADPLAGGQAHLSPDAQPRPRHTVARHLQPRRRCRVAGGCRRPHRPRLHAPAREGDRPPPRRGHRAARARGHRLRRRALPHRRAPRAEPPPHPRPGGLSGGTAPPRPRRRPRQHHDGPPPLRAGLLPAGRRAP